MYTPSQRPINSFASVNLRDVAALEPIPAQGKIITATQEPSSGSFVEHTAQQESVSPESEDETRPRTRPKRFENRGLPIKRNPLRMVEQFRPESLLPSPTGPSPGPSTSFKGEFLSATSIPPDTMGAVGLNHVVNVTNDRMRIQTREGIELSRVTLNTFWAGVTIKGATVSSFDPKILYDRFNDHWVLVSTFNAQSISSGVGFAVSQTSDPMGTWNRYTAESDPSSTAAGGRWIDYPSIGLDKDKLVVMYNVFNYGTAGSGYYGPYIYVLDKIAAYNNTLATLSLFQDSITNCTAPFEGKLGCGFTMNPSVVEDNTTTTNYMIEDWDSQAGQLRTSKITGTAAAPVLTVGTQFPQSPNSWRFNAKGRYSSAKRG